MQFSDTDMSSFKQTVDPCAPSHNHAIDLYEQTLDIVLNLSRLTVVSREAKKKQHARTSSGPRDHYSELFTRMAALKF